MSNIRKVDDDQLFAIKLSYKCPLKFKDMKGSERVRHCKACKKSVFNISDMTRQEAIELISAKEGDLCVTYYQRHDGTVVTRDCTSALGVYRVRIRHNLFAILNAALAFLANTIAPMLGPAVVTIGGGIGPIMQSSSEIDSDSDSDVEEGEVMPGDHTSEDSGEQPGNETEP